MVVKYANDTERMAALRAYQKRYRAANAEREREKVRKWYAEHREEVCAKHRARYAAQKATRGEGDKVPKYVVLEREREERRNQRIAEGKKPLGRPRKNEVVVG